MTEAMQVCIRCGFKTGYPSAGALANTSRSPQSIIAGGYVDDAKIHHWQWCVECNRLYEKRVIAKKQGK